MNNDSSENESQYSKDHGKIGKRMANVGVEKFTEDFCFAFDDEDWMPPPTEFFFNMEIKEKKIEMEKWFDQQCKELSVRFYKKFMPTMDVQETSSTIALLTKCGDISREILDSICATDDMEENEN